MLTRRLSSQISTSNLRYLTRTISSSWKLYQLQETKYIDVTKQNYVIENTKKLRQLQQQHVGAKSFWLDNLHELHLVHSERAKSQDELEPRSMKDSIQEVLIPLGTDLKERDKYLTFYNTVRIGKLLEDLDTLAGWVGFKYYKGPTERPPFSLVTACVDRINITDDYITATEDIKMKGFVSWAGTTSLEITIQLEQFDSGHGEWIPTAEAVFVMVARSLKDSSATVINPMQITTEEEKRYFEKGKENKVWRKKKTTDSLLKTPPTEKELDLVHGLFLKTLDPNVSSFSRRSTPDHTTMMADTRLKNILICHPQSRNLYNKIFGGFLMREAYELAWANTCAHIKSKPTLIAMDDVIFRRPVEVGSLLYLSSQVTFTKGKYLSVRVHAEVLKPKTGEMYTTNVFYFHFESKKDFNQVMPMSYAEYMLYLDGARHAEDVLGVEIHEQGDDV